MPGLNADLHCWAIDIGSKHHYNSNYDVAEGYDRYVLKEYFEKLPAINSYLTGSETKDFGSIADGGEESEEVTVVGAVLGDFAIASLTTDVLDLHPAANVTAADTVTVTMLNNTGGTLDLSSSTLTASVIKSTHVAFDKNHNFEVLGTNATTALVTFDADYAAIKITTAGADGDSMIITPHLDANISSWSVATRWGSENSVQWSSAITTGPAITTCAIFTGLKLSAAASTGGLVTTDTDQAYFLYSSVQDANTIASITTPANLHFIFSSNNVDYVTDLGIVVAINTTYHLKISIDSDRKVSAFVNGTQYGIAATAVAAGTTQTDSTAKSIALTDDKNLIPYIGIQEVGGSGARSLRIHYTKISRILFE